MKSASDYLGKTFEDKITGFKGVAVGYVIYLSGCNQVLLSPRVDEKGKLDDSRWIDEQRLAVDPSRAAVSLDNGDHPGSDISPPVR